MFFNLLKQTVLMLVCILLLNLYADKVFAATYYIAPSGNDNNSGTQSSPWKTIQKANSTIANGDTVILQDGIYQGYKINLNKANSTWRAQNRHRAIIDGGLSPTLLNGQWSNIVSAYNQKCAGQNTWVNLISVDAPSVIIDGLMLRNSCGRGILYKDTSSNSILKNSWIDWTMQAGLYVGAETQGIQAIGNYLTRNSFGDTYKMYTSGDYSVNISIHMSGQGMIVRDNIIAWGRGEIAMTGARNLLVEKNIIVGNKNNFYPGWAQNVVFRNNLVYAPESKDTTGTHWEKKGSDSTHNWHMSTRNEKDDRWSDYATGLTNIAYYNNLIINNQIGFDGYHRAGGAFLYSTDTTKVYFGHNTVIAGKEIDKLFGAQFNAAVFEGKTEDSLMTAIIENNIFDNRKNPLAKLDLRLSNNDRVVIRNNIIPTNADSSLNGENNIRINDPGLLDAARQLSIVPPPIGAETINITELQQAVRVMDYIPQTNSPGRDKGSILPGNADVSIPSAARSQDYNFYTRISPPDMGSLEFESISGQPDPPITGTRAALSVLLNGIGSAGDSINPQSLGNINPLHTQRLVSIELFNANNQSQGIKQGNLNFNNASGKFTGEVALGSIPSGTYRIRLHSPNYLKKFIPNTISININQANQLPTIALIAGDSNNDNNLSILDYNLIYDCFSAANSPRNCDSDTKKLSADLTDDGVVNQYDYNLFIRELSAQGGQNNNTPQPTNPNPTNPPNPTNTPFNQPTLTSNPPGDTQGEIKLIDEIVQFTQSDNGFHRLHEGNTDWPSHVPTNWKQPVNYYNGTWQYRIQVLANPSNQASKLQLCFWKIPGFEPENCAGGISQNGIGTYAYSSSPASWWKKNGVPLDFINPREYRASIILRGPNNCVVTTKGQVAKKCPELFNSLKDLRFKFTVVMVPSGRSFSGWGNY